MTESAARGRRGNAQAALARPDLQIRATPAQRHEPASYCIHQV